VARNTKKKWTQMTTFGELKTDKRKIYETRFPNSMKKE
jgi:hypothetical protein